MPILRKLRPVNADQDEGRVPLKPLPETSNIWRLVKVLKKSREPRILEAPETYILVRFFMLDHEGGMVVIGVTASLKRLPMLRKLRPVNLDQDEGRVPLKPLP